VRKAENFANTRFRGPQSELGGNVVSKSVKGRGKCITKLKKNRGENGCAGNNGRGA